MIAAVELRQDVLVIPAEQPRDRAGHSGGCPSRLLRAAILCLHPSGALRAGWTASGPASADSGGGENDGSGPLRPAAAIPVLVERQRADHQGEPEQVHMLAGVSA